MRNLVPIAFCLFAFAVAAQSDHVSAYVAGVAALEAEDYTEAARWFEEALDEKPEFADAHYGLARAYAAESPMHDERKVSRELGRALRIHPDNARYLEAQLAALRRRMPEASAFSTTDTRRPTLAGRLLAVDSTNALAHEELALSAFLEFDWRRQMARRQGGWNPDETRGTSGAANRARLRAEEHLTEALKRNPARIETHRLRLRVAALAEDDAALSRAAEAFATALPDEPGAQLYQGLAAYRKGDIEAAEQYFAGALEAMPSGDRAGFERVAHLLSEEEEALLETDSSAAAEQFWRTRDPRLLSPQNERRLEHYARLALADLLYADTRKGARGWSTPRGDVVVRYGAPDESGRWLGVDFSAKRFGTLERWVYAEHEDEDGFSLLFEDPFRNGDFDFMSSAAGEDDATRARNLFHRIPERFAYRPPGGLVEFPFLAVPFKGPAGQTTLVVPIGIPISILKDARVDLSDPGRKPVLETGVFLLAPNGVPQAEIRHETERLRLGSAVDAGAGVLWTKGFAITASPGTYTLAVEFEQSETGRVGVVREEVVLPSFTSTELSISGLLPAFLVEEAEPGAAVHTGWIRRGDFFINPAPTGHFTSDVPIYLYVEAYGLALENGRTSYEIETVLRPVEEAGMIARTLGRLLGRRPPAAVSVQFAISGTSPDEGQYVIFDASGQEPGVYELTLRIHDQNAGATVETSRILHLDSPK